MPTSATGYLPLFYVLDCRAGMADPSRDLTVVSGQGRDPLPARVEVDLPIWTPLRIAVRRARAARRAGRSGSGELDLDPLACRRDARRPAGRRAGTGARAPACPAVPYSGSPHTGCPIARRCTRIWWVRPVSRRTPQQRGCRQRPLEHEVGARLAGAGAADRHPRAHARSRPIGASIVPLRAGGRPSTSARYSRSISRSARARCSRRWASCVRATTSRPEVPRSRRCTIPGRTDPSRAHPARRRPRRSAAPAAGRGCPRDGRARGARPGRGPCRSPAGARPGRRS